MALPFLRAYASGGEAEVAALAERLGEGVRALLLLIGARSPAHAATLPHHLGSALRSWIAS
jgi:hypothetical protein